MNPIAEDIRNSLMHYGMPRRSGRYPWGSGDDAYQHERDFLGRIEDLKKNGWTETPENIQKEFGMTTTQYRTEKGIASNQRRMLEVARAKSLKEDGLGYTEIGRKMGLNESTVRSLLNERSEAKMNQAKKTAEFLKEQLNTKGAGIEGNYGLDVGKDVEKFIDLGDGAEKKLGISRTKLDQALYALESEGYVVLNNGIPQPNNPGQQTNQVVLCPPGTPKNALFKDPKIFTIEDYQYQEGVDSFKKKFTYPTSLDSKRLMVRYADDVGPDGFKGIEKDGVIELRRGVEDLDLKGSRYAQVRIMVDGTHYLKGMAVYSDNMPDGVDVIFNTNKKKGTPALGDKDHTVLKPIKKDPDNPFGTTIKDVDDGGQYWYKDSKTGEEKLGLINKKSSEGDWSEWSDALPSQFLSKQSKQLAERQLTIAKNAMRSLTASSLSIIQLLKSTS